MIAAVAVVRVKEGVGQELNVVESMVVESMVVEAAVLAGAAGGGLRRSPG